jgi:hypothetical protein
MAPLNNFAGFNVPRQINQHIAGRQKARENFHVIVRCNVFLHKMPARIGDGFCGFAHILIIHHG